MLIVVPELGLTAEVTAGNYGQYQVWQRVREVIVPEVIGAVKTSNLRD